MTKIKYILENEQSFISARKTGEKKMIALLNSYKYTPDVLFMGK